MLRRMGIVAAMVLMAGAAIAAEHEVKMLNKGESGTMIFEPAFVKAAAGDTIRFVPVDKGHNVESIKGMLPDGVDKFKSKVNEEYVMTPTVPGLYGVKCSPHFAMGMVALIQVGEVPPNVEAVKAVKLPKKADERIKEALAASFR
ncbi:Pseudoazurin precursor (plasmid) [Sinorhizobium fredii NGR234]|uniref:Pseudoazurin n=1 Tax=Sinorhizobium fredii (strain NBRC 101917 / NGR234) TaxID=394 RepID=C3KNX7_SINFN|nr:pseudoazurin [Sinorhizobium fredii]ACP21785.1 Pseudoazurin precursor [Sinorhizobium fredii NGR234]